MSAELLVLMTIPCMQNRLPTPDQDDEAYGSYYGFYETSSTAIDKLISVQRRNKNVGTAIALADY